MIEKTLDRVKFGFIDNKSLETKDLLLFAHGLINDSMPQLIIK